MEFNIYQKLARKTAIYPEAGNNFAYPVLGLCGEAGEVAEKCKKIIRDQNSIWNKNNLIDLEKELGDVLWYIANVASEFQLKLSDIAQKNINKLYDRKKRNVLSGSGDDR